MSSGANPAFATPLILSEPDVGAWKRFVDAHPKGSIFHTPEMYKVFCGTTRHTPLALAALDEEGELLALVTSVRVQTLPYPFSTVSSRVVMYAEPLCSPTSEATAAMKALLRVHDDMYRQKALFAEVRVVGPPGSECEPLMSSGYQPVGFLNFLIDLRTSEGELWGRLTTRCRSNIRRGQKHGVRVEEMTNATGVKMTYELLRETFHRARVPLADISLFEQAVVLLAPAGLINIFIAFQDNEAIAASIVLPYKNVVYEWYCGANILKPLHAAECLTWHRIEWAHQQGFTLYDFGGAGSPEKSYGVRDFKAKFGAELVNYGRYRKVYSPRKLTLAESIYEWSRKRPHVLGFGR